MVKDGRRLEQSRPAWRGRDRRHLDWQRGDGKGDGDDRRAQDPVPRRLRALAESCNDMGNTAPRAHLDNSQWRSVNTTAILRQRYRPAMARFCGTRAATRPHRQHGDNREDQSIQGA